MNDNIVDLELYEGGNPSTQAQIYGLETLISHILSTLIDQDEGLKPYLIASLENADQSIVLSKNELASQDARDVIARILRDIS